MKRSLVSDGLGGGLSGGLGGGLGALLVTLLAVLVGIGDFLGEVLGVLDRDVSLLGSVADEPLDVLAGGTLALGLSVPDAGNQLGLLGVDELVLNEPLKAVLLLSLVNMAVTVGVGLVKSGIAELLEGVEFLVLGALGLVTLGEANSVGGGSKESDSEESHLYFCCNCNC